MAVKKLDITGKVCPYCVLAVRKEVPQLHAGDELVVLCDHPSAATSSIPQFAEENGMSCFGYKVESGLWELKLMKR